VIAYGHFIKPPFVIKYVANKLMINGVQVWPSLVWEREYKAKKPAAPELLKIIQRTMDARKEIRSRYKWHKLYKWKELLKEDILTLAKSKDVVLDAKWDNDAFLISFSSGTGFEFMELGTPSILETWKYKFRRARMKDPRQLDIETIEKLLKRGTCVVFSNAGRLHINDPRERVNGIMKDSSLTYEKKLIC